MKILALALCATFCLATSAFAQSPDAAPPASAPPADQGGGGGGGAGGGGGGGGNKMKDIMQACRTEAKGQGLKGHDLHQAIADCVVKQKPGMADRMKCRMAGMDKGLKPGEDLKAFVKDCMKKG